MKRVFFCIFVTMALSLFFLFSCGKSSTLYDAVLSATASDGTLPAGIISVYGRDYENKMSEDYLSDYLGLSGYPEFAGKIEELALYSSLTEPYCELAVMRLYSISDAQDGALFMSRRLSEAKRLFNYTGQNNCAKDGYVKICGNVVALYMMPDNERAENAVSKKF